MCVLGNGYRLSAQTSCVPRNGHGLFVWTVFSLEDTHFPPLYSLPACFLAETIVIFHQETTVYLFASLFSPTHHPQLTPTTRTLMHTAHIHLDRVSRMYIVCNRSLYPLHPLE